MFARKMDSLGRVVIPREIRAFMGISSGEKAPIDFEFRDNGVFITRKKACCLICGDKEVDNLVLLQDGRPICYACVRMIQGLIKE